MKIKNDENEVVTKGMFRRDLKKAVRETVDELALLINKSFQGMESRMATKEDLRALRNELHEEIHAVDTRADVADLQCRVGKPEKKAIL